MVKFPQYILPVLTILRPSPQQHLPKPKHGVVAAVVLCVLTHAVKHLQQVWQGQTEDTSTTQRLDTLSDDTNEEASL